MHLSVNYKKFLLYKRLLCGV
nr:unnamed protein product [Callosobruchus chinensis]